MAHGPRPKHLAQWLCKVLLWLCSTGVQVAALPWRRTAEGGIEVLLITSRKSRHWIIPKGWPMAGRSPPQAAAREAFEEAGVVGRAESEPAGQYVYRKRLWKGMRRPVRVAVYPLEVASETASWPEHRRRARRWLDPREAARTVDEPGLRRVIRGFVTDRDKATVETT